jgi:hypothetical protein
MKIKGKLLFRNSYAFIWDGHREINLFSWLASLGLKDKEVTVTLEKVGSKKCHLEGTGTKI